MMIQKPEPWRCTSSREEIMRIWSVPNPEEDLKTENERRIYGLLMKYNGTYKAYVEWEKARDLRSQIDADLAGKHIRHEKNGLVVTKDVDERARLVLREIEKVCANSNPFTQSSVLHTSDQKFPTAVLRLELERELDRLLREQILERERLVNMLDQEGGDTLEKDNAEFKAGIVGVVQEGQEETDGK